MDQVASMANAPTEELGDVAVWNRLADPDPRNAYKAVARLIEDPDHSVTLLFRHMTEKLNDAEVEQWVTNLEADGYAVRTLAQRNLDAICDRVQPAIHRAIMRTRSKDALDRLQSLIANPVGSVGQPSTWQRVRAVYVLERIGSPKAITLLKTLANGKDGSRTSWEAGAALTRLTERP
jgi:HEAT repeat protein